MQHSLSSLLDHHHHNNHQSNGSTQRVIHRSNESVSAQVDEQRQQNEVLEPRSCPVPRKPGILERIEIKVDDLHEKSDSIMGSLGFLSKCL